MSAYKDAQAKIITFPQEMPEIVYQHVDYMPEIVFYFILVIELRKYLLEFII